MALARLIRPLLVLTGLLMACRVLAWGTAGPWTAVRRGSAEFHDMVGLAAATVAWALLGWVVLALGATALATLPGLVGAACAALADRLTPAAARHLAHIAVGFAVVAGPVAAGPATIAVAGSADAARTAAAAVPGVDRPGSVRHAAMELPDVERPGGPPGWTPAVPAAGTPRADPATAEPEAAGPAGGPLGAGSSLRDPTTQTARTTSTGHLLGSTARESPFVDDVIVRRGDSLWTIAARVIGPDATDAQIAVEWPRWWKANRDTIGDDPDLLLPGTALRAPALD